MTTMNKTKAFEIRNLADREAEVFLYGEIAWDVAASDFVRELSLLDVDVIRLHVNSPGGDAYQGIAMMNALQSHPARVEATVEGMAFSAASFIVVGGADRVVIYPGAEMMIHDALASSYGNADDMSRSIERLDRMSNSIAEIYARRAGGDPEDWREAMRAETWFTAQEAVDAGLADEVWEPEEEESERPLAAVASSDFALLNRFRGRQAPPPRQLMNSSTSCSKDTTMNFKDIVANKLGVKSDDLTEEQVLEALDEVLAEQREDDETPTPSEDDNKDAEESTSTGDDVDDDDEESASDDEDDNEEPVQPAQVVDLETVTLDMDTYNELKNAAAAGHELAQRRADENLAAEVDRWVAEGRISNALRSRALDAMRADADQARRVYGSNPVNTIPRREIGSSNAQEVQPVRNSSRPRPDRSDNSDEKGGGKEYNAPYRGFAARPRLMSNQA